MGTRARKFVKSILGFTGSQRRERLGVDVHYWEDETWSARNTLAAFVKRNLPDKILGTSVLSRTDKWATKLLIKI